MFTQIVELAAASAIIGSGLNAEKLRPILIRVFALVIFLPILTITLQSLGWATVLR